MPWAITSVAVTVVGCAYFWSVSPVNPKNKGKGHGHGHDSHGDKAAEATEEDEDESPDGEDDSKAVADNGEAEKDGTGNPKDIHRPGSMTGQEVPPPPAQEGSDAENATSEKKEEYKETIKNKDTKVATSSSDIPSKKTGLKFPDEDSKSDEDDSK
ncbi:hypothetical protein GGR56DRAFT_654483 [Xylariaceae sp. FL0804]|nr:hypothetical protein GGR56DRAFT_654483 [Xylariaceae sp. FL0804]